MDKSELTVKLMELAAKIIHEQNAHVDAFLQKHAASRETHELRIYLKGDGSRVYCIAPNGAPAMTLDEAMATLPVLSLDCNITVDSKE